MLWPTIHRGALCGGLTLLAYRFGMDMRRHHREHNNRRPILYDHLIVTPPIVAFWSLYFKPQQFTVAFMASAGISNSFAYLSSLVLLILLFGKEHLPPTLPESLLYQRHH